MNSTTTTTTTIRSFGDPSCPCLPASNLTERVLIDKDFFMTSFGGGDLNSSSSEEEVNLLYGIGCAAHDEFSLTCYNSSIDRCADLFLSLPDCHSNICEREFCYVDPYNCNLSNTRPSKVFEDVFYSYSTCGYLDSTNSGYELLESLKGKTFQVGINSNSGGWMGSYNIHGSFAMNMLWTGPMFAFVQQTAFRGGFEINMTKPPDFVKDLSIDYFGGESEPNDFDYCIYATALGHLDFCVGSYTISAERSLAVPMIEISNSPLYLMVLNGQEKNFGKTFALQFLTVFRPFTTGSWIMIFVFCIPLLSLLMLFHEYDQPGKFKYIEEERRRRRKILGFCLCFFPTKKN